MSTDSGGIMMNVLQLLIACKEKQITQFSVVECYFSEQYPALFFSLLLQKMRSLGLHVATVSATDTDVHAVQAMISSSFLGQSYVVWLGNCSEFDTVQQKKIEQLLVDYQGPHTIIRCVQKKEAKHIAQKQHGKKIQDDRIDDASKRLVVNLDQQLTKEVLSLLFDFFWNIKIDSFEYITRGQYATLSLDSIVMLGMYCVIMGRNTTDEFMSLWYPKLVAPEQSLFELAQHFFARKASPFFKQWMILKDAYPMPFWTTFWSEQLWRAYHVIDLRKKGQFNDAKIMG